MSKTAIFDMRPRLTPDSTSIIYRDNAYGYWIQAIEGGEPRTLREIAVKAGVSRPTISKIIKDAGVTVARKARTASGYEADILRMYVNEDKPVIEIAKLLSLTNSTVAELLRSRGVKIKKGGMRTIVFPELRKLNIGESLELPRIGLNK